MRHPLPEECWMHILNKCNDSEPCEFLKYRPRKLVYEGLYSENHMALSSCIDKHKYMQAHFVLLVNAWLNCYNK